MQLETSVKVFQIRALQQVIFGTVQPETSAKGFANTPYLLRLITKEVRMALQEFYGMSNDYMFHAVLQRSFKVRKKLVADLLLMDPEEISSVVIWNPIELGNSLDEKNSILDLEVEVNHEKTVNLEL